MLTSKRVAVNMPESATSKQRSVNPFLSLSTETKPQPNPFGPSSNPGPLYRRQDPPGHHKKAPLSGSLLGNKNKELFQQHAKEARQQKINQQQQKAQILSRDSGSAKPQQKAIFSFLNK